MSQGVSDLTSKVNQLHSAISSVGAAANSAFANVGSAVSAGVGQKGLGVSGNQNTMFGSLANFSTPTPSANTAMGAVTPGVVAGEPAGTAGGGGLGLGKFGAVAAAASVGGAVVSTAVNTVFGGMIDTNTIVNRAGAYFQAAQFGNGITRAKLENATFSALQGQITSMGSDARTANILTNAGYMPGSQDYLNTVSQVAGAARTLGMPNENAAQAMATLGSGSMGANLYQYGITTLDNKGNQLSVGNIAQQMYNTMALPGTTPESLMASFKNGNLAGNFQGMGITGDLQPIMLKAMQDIAAGKNPDLASAQNMQGNNNPFSPLYQTNAAQTGTAAKSETAAIQGLQTAADTVTAFNKAFGDTIASMEGYKAYLDGLSGTNAGKAGSSLLKGGMNILKKVAGIGLMGIGALSSEVGVGVPIAAAGAALTFGGGTPGFGGSFSGGKSRGGGTPNNNPLAPSNSLSSVISANYGDVDSTVWGSTGGKHLGTDFAVDIGTSVVAVKDGIVSGQSLSPDYGDAVVVDHLDGYSTIYAHLSQKSVSPGTKVSQGQSIGKSGKSGNTTGPGLHYEVQKGLNNPVNPSELQGAILPITDTSPFASAGNPLTAAGGLLSVQNSLSGSVGNGGAVNPNAGSAGDQEFAKALLTKAGITISDSNVSALTTWMHWEGGTANNSFNPLNTTLPMPGSSKFNSIGVQSYGSLDQGVQATLDTLTGNQADARGYTNILNDLRNNASLKQVTNDINSSKWGTKIHGGGTPGYGTSLPNIGATVAPSPSSITSSPANTAATSVNIYLTISQASESEAVLLAKRVKTIIEESHSAKAIGRS
jgi:murein DD-endopeptidase MepM/ murein hydrolase activator NlpD